MYLALLAGGQIIKKVVKRTLGISGSDGLAIFDFPIDRVTLKNRIIKNINALELSEEEKTEIIQEKLLIFKMNNDIASSIKPTVGSYSRLLKLSISIAFVVSIVSYFGYRLFSK